jgi:hypothetical protein
LGATLQASHWPLQPVAQHTPSTQIPLEHSFPAAHDAPLTFFTAQLASVVQKALPAHSASLAHVVAHPLPTH